MKALDVLSVVGIAAVTAAVYTVTVGDKVKKFVDKKIEEHKQHD